MTTRTIETVGLAAGIQADLGRRTITGLVAPWDTYATLAAGGRVAFAPGSITVPDPLSRLKLNVDHQSGRPVGTCTAAHATPAGLLATFKIGTTPDGDTVLLEAAEGLRDGLSVGADVEAGTDTDDGLYVTSARARHVALVSEPAYDDARVATVVAAAPNGAQTMTMTEPATSSPPAAPPTSSSAPPARVHASSPTDPDPTPPTPPTDPPDPELTAAGRAAQVPIVQVSAEPYPYGEGSGHSLLRDAFTSRDDGDAAALARIRRAQAMNSDPRLSAVAGRRMLAFGRRAQVQAATGDTTNNAAIVPPQYRPDWWTPLVAYESPVYNAATKSPISDFTPFTIPRELSRTGLSGTPADQVTPVAPGDIQTNLVTVTPQQVYGAYQFSRALAMSSNPAIDQIAQDAMDQEWLKDVETRAITYLLANATAASGTYADGAGFITSMRGHMAAQRTTRHAPTRNIITSTKEYVGAVSANDTAARPLLGWDGAPIMYGPGTQGDAARDATILGVPTLPEGAAPVGPNVSLLLAAGDFVCFATPLMNFRIEYDGHNPLVITVAKYSGVAFWLRYVLGARKVTNTTPLPLTDDFDVEPPAEVTSGADPGTVAPEPERAAVASKSSK